MKKIRLDLERLAVESFVPQEGSVETGTVEGNQLSAPQCTVIDSCNDLQTCARRLSYYNSCVVECECTNARFRCLRPDV